MTPTARKIGCFELTSHTVAICDPGYREDALDIGGGLGCYVRRCKIGEWQVWLTEDKTPNHSWEMPRTLLAAIAGFSTSRDSDAWHPTGKEIGGDYGMIGVFDQSHFHDDKLVPIGQRWTFDGAPADPSDLWYSFVCESVRNQVAAAIPHGFVVNWDGGMDVETLSSDGEIVAIRLSISGWPDRV